MGFSVIHLFNQSKLAKQGWRLITKQLKWVPPDGEVLKINIDAAFHAEELRGGTGVVVRNNSGLLIRAQALWYEHVANAMTMEAYAIRDAVILAMEQGYHKVAVESDAQSFVKLWEEDHGGRSEVAVIFQEIRELCGVFTSFCIALLIGVQMKQPIFVLRELVLREGDVCG
jgi:hypothetical protein